ncbi:24275_t:CDS:10, partial [Racocetra persica]
WLVINDEDDENQDNDVDVSRIHIDVKKNATEFLCTKKKIVNLISIFGPARAGKSTLMNILAGVDNYENEIFESSPAMKTITTGVDISKTFIPLKEFSKINDNLEIDGDALVGFVDTEGQGNKGDEFDLCLFSPILVTSKIVIFWWHGAFLTDRILSSLAAMTKSAQRITQDIENQNQNAKLYGHLHIIFRSWDNNNNSTPEDVKKLLLEPQKGRKNKDKEHNTIRKLLNDSFESIDVWLFPLSDLSQSRGKLLFKDFNENWKQIFKKMRKKFSEQLSVNESKDDIGKPRTGQDIAEFTELLCNELNNNSETYTITSIFERTQIARAKTLTKNAKDDYRTLVYSYDIKAMNARYEVEGHDDKGIDAYLYKELEKFRKELELESFSDEIVEETYGTYSESACLIVNDIKMKIADIERFEKLIKPLQCNFDNIVKNLPESLVQQHRNNFGEFCKVTEQNLMMKNNEKIIETLSFAQNKAKENLEMSVTKLENRLPMKKEKLESEWLVLLKQSKEMYSNLDVFNTLPDDVPLIFPENLHTLSNSIWEALIENNSNAWENKADALLKRAEMLFKRDLATNFPVNNKKVFNDTEIEQYLQEEVFGFSHKVANIFPHTMMHGICTKYKETARLIVMEFQKENDKNIGKILQKIERYILNWDILLDTKIKVNLEKWQHKVTKLLLISTTIPKLVTLPSFHLLCICNDLTNLNIETIPSSFRKVIKSIKRHCMMNTLSEQFVNEILEGLKSNDLKYVRMSFINRCLGISTLIPTIQQLFYEQSFEYNPFISASPIIQSIFLAEYEKYQKEKDQNRLTESKDYQRSIKKNVLDSPIAALSCDIIQKTFFVHYDLTKLHHNFFNAVNSLTNINIEPLQSISAIAFLKEYVRTLCDANKTILKEYVRKFRNANRTTSKATMRIDTDMKRIISSINDLMNWKQPRIHSLKIYFLKYLRSCNFSMQDIRDLCESQDQFFPWLKEIPWNDKENQHTFNPYWLHRDYKHAEDYYYHICDELNRNEANPTSFASYLEMAQSGMHNIFHRVYNWGVSLFYNGTLNKNDLNENSLITFAGVIAARLHYIRTSRELTDNEKRVVNYLSKEIKAMNTSLVYKETLKNILFNSNSLIQLFKDNKVDENPNQHRSEDNELLMKSVIVHLMILHASIQNNASPLAAYLHQLHVCQNDFILTCPSDIEGVVMNAVASIRNADGAEEGVTRYKCICGEKFFVFDCGAFGNPTERDPVSVSGKCANCKKGIGYGSTESEYERLDENKITSVSIKHEPGYIVEQISTKTTQNVRMMTPQSYRILHLFVHALLGASVPSSVTSEFFAKNGNNAGDAMEHCIQTIRNDWNVLKEIFDCDNEQLALILHSIIFSMIEKSSSDEWRLDTSEKRENWEHKFSMDLNFSVTNVMVMAKDIRNKLSENRISLTEEEIDDMLSAKDEKYHNENLPRLWRKIKDVNFKSLHAYYMINTAYKAKFPFLEVFFRHEKKLHLIKNLLPILKFVQVLKTRLEYQITRQKARVMTFDNFINKESNNGKLQEISSELHSSFSNFKEAWNEVAPHVKGYQCLQFEEFPQISLNSSVIFGLAEEKDDGIYLWAILSYLIELQNLFLEETIAIPFGLCLSLKFLETNVENTPAFTTQNNNNDRIQYYLQTVQIQHAQLANFIDYERNDEILRYSQRNLEIRYGEDIIYDLYQIEMELARQLVFNKSFITLSESFPYFEEMFLRNFYVLTCLNDFVTQEPLPIANIDADDYVFDESFSSENASKMHPALPDDHVFDKSFSSENESRMLPALEMLICSIHHEINNETPVKDYISRQLDLSVLIENAEFCGMIGTNLRLKHLISLYEKVENMKTCTFDDIQAKYKEPLSLGVRTWIIEAAAFENSWHKISAFELLIALKRFMVRYLMAESSDISSTDKLTDYITNKDLRCWPSDSSLKIAKNLFPSELQVCHTYALYKLISFRQTGSQSSV